MMKQFFRSPFWILRAGLILTFFWFGWSELLKPHLWTQWIPDVVRIIPLSKTTLVLLHGISVMAAVTLLLFEKTVRWGGGLIALLLLQIIFFLGINEITVRDFAILTGALTLFFFYKKYLPSL